jgi:hypothetical protein
VSKTSQPNFFLPRIWEEISDTTNFYGWDFLRSLIGRGIFWASVDWYNQDKNLPPGYSGYVIKTEGPNVEWIERQVQLVQAPMFVCCLYKDYGRFDHLPGVYFVPAIEWHYQLDVMSQQFGAQVNKNIRYKISALCHRGTQSKIIALSALAQHHDLENCLISLHDNIEEKNIHSWQSTGNLVIDQHTQYFLENLHKKSIIIDKFDKFSNLDVMQVYDFHHPAYVNSAINVNNESFHYSLTTINDQKKFYPGPFVTEKTLKCLLGETAFINNGQFNTYSTLTSLGFKFDYGIDLTYDQAPGDLQRMSGMLTVIKNLKDHTTQELYEQTRDSCLHNKDHIMSGSFWHQAESVNLKAVDTILSNL